MSTAPDPEPRHPHAPHAAVRVGGFLLIAAGGLGVVLGLVGPRFANGRGVVPTTIGAIAAVLGFYYVLRSDRVPAWALPLMPALGTVMIATSSYPSRTVTDGNELRTADAISVIG